ncbi:MAG: sulfurtransferase [Aquimonas sp.]|nr:sulfurtransferase [Aquimonas sp.]
MDWRTLVSADELKQVQGTAEVSIVDCRFDLRDPSAGERAFALGHIAGASYAHLERDLSEMGRAGRGRHPLPDAERFCAALARFGITPRHQVVAYDGRDGAFASRLWWLLRLLGHERVAVLEGGLEAWIRAGGAMGSGTPRIRAGGYRARFRVRDVVSTAVLAARLANGGTTLIDARARERFRGEIEPLDPVAGHVPGAINRPYIENLETNGLFKQSSALRQEFECIIRPRSPDEVVLMCGSGVTACHNLLAMEYAGLHGARIYAGSWSEWCSDPHRPVQRGDGIAPPMV